MPGGTPKNAAAADSGGYTAIASTTADQFGDGKQYTVSLLTAWGMEPGGLSLQVSGNGIDEIIPINTKDIIPYRGPEVFVGDFTGDGITDIFVKIPTESADGLSPLLGYVCTYMDGQLKKIFSSDEIDYSYTVTHEDNYMTKIYSHKLDQSFYGDNSGTYKEKAYAPIYEDSEMAGRPIYDEQGRAQKDIPHYDVAIVQDMSVFNEATNSTLARLEGTGENYGLCVTQTIWGTNIRDYVGDILTYLKWDDASGHFVVNGQMYHSLH